MAIPALQEVSDRNVPHKFRLVGGDKGHNIIIIPYREALRHAQGRELSRTAPARGRGAPLRGVDDPMNTSLSIDALKLYFKCRGDVAFAFLFGSQARGTATRVSDVDIALYFYPGKRHPIEYEEKVFYGGEDEIWGDLEKLLKREVELLVLNRVSATAAASAIRGIPLAINDWGLYLDFMEVVTSEAEDFMEFYINDYMERHPIEERG